MNSFENFLIQYKFNCTNTNKIVNLIYAKTNHLCMAKRVKIKDEKCYILKNLECFA